MIRRFIVIVRVCGQERIRTAAWAENTSDVTSMDVFTDDEMQLMESALPGSTLDIEIMDISA